MTALRRDATSGSAAAPAPELLAVDHLEWWVGNARAFAGFLCSAYGFQPIAYAGPETGRADTASYVVTQGSVRFVLTSSLVADSPVAAHVRRHGDGVKAVAFSVDGVDGVWRSLVDRGAVGLAAPADQHDGHGSVRAAAVAAYGETTHVLIDRHGYAGPFLPGYAVCDLVAPVGPAVGLTAIDHTVANVEQGALDQWVHFYEDVFGFRQLQHFEADQIATEFSALRSTVVGNGGTVVFPINEPAEGRKKSQIEEYLDYYGCAGVQHIAMASDDIVSSVRALRARGVRFMAVPDTYYREARARMAGLDLPWDDLAAQSVLVDRDQAGYLLQIFTEPLGDRPTVFFEIIQRAGATGFGEGNFKALFEAIERAQAERGNL
jgi:4-hydroxyphenylpyruvate dioxygenase